MIKSRIKFDVTLWTPEDFPNSAVITFPYSALDVFGTKGRVPVRFSVDGHVFRSSLAPMGGEHIIPFNAEMRAKTGYKAGDTIHVIMEKDNEPREVEIPIDVAKALNTDKTAKETFVKYSYSHKREVMDWINDAQKPETQQKRILRLLQTLSSGKSL